MNSKFSLELGTSIVLLNQYFISHHFQVPLQFSTFIDYCKKHMQNKDGSLDACFGPLTRGLEGSDTGHGYLHLEDAPEQIYLAQVEIQEP